MRERRLRRGLRMLGPVFGHLGDAVDRADTEPRAQMLDERRHLACRRMTALAGRPQWRTRERPLAERTSAQFATSHGLGQHEICEALTQQGLQPSGVCFWMGQPQRAEGGRRAIVMETALQRGDATLPGAQELLELVQQWTQGLEDAFVIFDFMIEIETSSIPFAPHETTTRVGATPEQAVEIGEPLDTESLGKTRARQAHELTQRAHPHGCEPRHLFRGPTQHGQW